jgi:urease alpha subunit
MGKQDMVINDALPKIKVDPESFVITINTKKMRSSLLGFYLYLAYATYFSVLKKTSTLL